MQALKSKPMGLLRFRELRSSCWNLATEAFVQMVLGELAEKPSSDAPPLATLPGFNSSSEGCLRYGSSLGDESATGLLQPDPAFGAGRDWAAGLWNESLQVMQVIRDSPTEQSSYATLLSDLPETTCEFCADLNLETDEGKSNALLRLVSFHKGEVVELSPALNEWVLAEGARPIPEEVLHYWNEQFLCLQATPVERRGRKRGRQPLVAVARPVGTDQNDTPRRWEVGQLKPWDDDIGDKAAKAARALAVARPGDLEPDWKRQTLRSVVPCRAAPAFHWRRVRQCITLGRLFAQLGKDFSADALYHFYRSRRIVVAKMRKGK